MFAIAHAYLLECLVARPTAGEYLGCVWPDMLFTGPLTHHQTHREGMALLAFIQRDAPDLLPFARAALSHGAEPHGFDWYSDDAYDPGTERGYAFERARPLVADVVAATHIDPALGWWKAHNFVEMSFEMALGRQFPHLGRAVASACADADLVTHITIPLARHFGVAADALAWNIVHFPETVAMETPTALDLADAYSRQLELKHGVTDADIPAMAAIIDHAWDLIAPDRDLFLATAIREVGTMLAAIV
jgi:hypothetical protein